MKNGKHKKNGRPKDIGAVVEKCLAKLHKEILRAIVLLGAAV